MKKYIKPEMNVELFEIEDVITISFGGDVLGRLLKTDVNGNEGTNYESLEALIFD